ncbi:hypothetical protein VTO42DRAFT_8738 [Malbranchea cinnamomea]
MQRLARRAALARRQAERKAKAVAEKDRKHEWWANFQEKVAAQRDLLEQEKEERARRREDWLLGPLAPRRDVGEKFGLYGTVPSSRIQPPKVEKAKRRKYVNFAPGDRVCLIKGREKGKIGKVLTVNAEAETLTVDGVNMHDVEFPPYVLKGDGDKRPYRPYPLPISFDDVRLVVPLEDETTGAVKDVLVKHVYGGEPFLERPYGTNIPKHTRYISGLDIEIPWPEEQAPEFKDEPADTLRIDVEARTFVPALQSFPMPSTVIDELRNKYSKFRTRHDPEYIAEQEKRDLWHEWQRSRTLLTPETEYKAKKAEEKVKQRECMKDEHGNYKLSNETTNFIEKYLQQAKAEKQAQTSSTLANA